MPKKQILLVCQGLVLIQTGHQGGRKEGAGDEEELRRGQRAQAVTKERKGEGRKGEEHLPNCPQRTQWTQR